MASRLLPNPANYIFRQDKRDFAMQPPFMRQIKTREYIKSTVWLKLRSIAEYLSTLYVAFKGSWDIFGAKPLHLSNLPSAPRIIARYLAKVELLLGFHLACHTTVHMQCSLSRATLPCAQCQFDPAYARPWVTGPTDGLCRASTPKLQLGELVSLLRDDLSTRRTSPR
jgi:hypothetical protein